MMTVGQKIKRLRLLKKLSQKELAFMCGLSEPAIRNYELGNRTPSAKQIEKIAKALGVSIYAISNPDLGNYHGAAHALFELEEEYGLLIDKIDGVIVIRAALDNKGATMQQFLRVWNEMKQRLENGEITQEEYDMWKYNYPSSEAERCHKRLRETRMKEKKSDENK